MTPGIPATLHRCPCGRFFPRRHCTDLVCRRCRQHLPAQARLLDALAKDWIASEQERWTKHITERLEPFLGQPWMNEVIARLLGKPVTKRDAA